MTNNKGYPLPTIISPDDTICIQMNIPDEPDHVRAFLGSIYTLTRWHSWQRNANKDGKDVAQVWQLVYDELERTIYTDICGCDDKRKIPMLRQNPDDLCQVQYLDDNGFWVTFLDFGLCNLFDGLKETQAIADYSTTTTTTTIVNDNTTIYNGNPTGYQPQTDVNAIAQANRDTLICYALRITLTTVLETMARNKGQAEANQITLSMILGAGVALFFAPFTPIIAGGILLSFGAGWFAGIASIDVSSLRNQSALDEVICHIYGVLFGDNMSRASFVSALATNPFDVGTDAYKQAQILAPMMDDTNFYLAFIELMKNNIATVGALVNECDSCGEEWSVTLDFRASQHGFNIIDGWGSYNAGFGFAGITKQGTTNSPVNCIIGKWWGTDVNITSIRAFTIRSEGRVYNYSDMRTTQSDGLAFSDTRTIFNVGNGWQAVRVGGSNWQGIRLQMSGTAFQLTSGGIQQVEIIGTGFNPFA